HGFCVRRADVQIWSFVLLLNFSNKLKLCAPKPARTQSPKTLAATLPDDSRHNKMTNIIKSKIGFSSRYYEPFRILQAKVASQSVFKLIHNSEKGTYSLPYLYAGYKNELEPVSISNNIIQSI